MNLNRIFQDLSFEFKDGLDTLNGDLIIKHGFIEDKNCYGSEPLLSNIDNLLFENYTENFEEIEVFENYNNLEAYVKQVVQREDYSPKTPRLSSSSTPTVEVQKPEIDLDQKIETKKSEILIQNQPEFKEKKSKISTLLKKLSSKTQQSIPEPVVEPVKQVQQIEKVENETKKLVIVRAIGSMTHLSKTYGPFSMSIDDNLINDFSTLNNFESVNYFIKKYGMSFYFGSLTRKELLFQVVEISTESPEMSLDELKITGMFILNKKYSNIIRNDPNIKIFEKDNKQYSLNCIERKLGPLYSYLKSSTTRCTIDELLIQKYPFKNKDPRLINYLGIVCDLRIQNYKFKQEFRSKFRNLIFSKYFNFDTYWDQTIYNNTVDYLIRKYSNEHHKTNSDSGYIKSLIKDHIKKQMDLEQPWIDRMIRYDVHFLAQANSLENFLEKNKKNFDIIIFYYNNPLKIYELEKFKHYFNTFIDCIERKTNKSKLIDKMILGVMVDYDLHPGLRKLKPFYNQCFKIEYCYDIPFKIEKDLLSSNGQDRIEFNDIVCYQPITKVDFSANYLFGLSSYCFRKFNFCSNLTHLILKENNLMYLEDGTFDSFKLLTHLDLSSNRLSEISRYIFKELNNLEYLSLANNLIEIIDAESFKMLKNLKFLYLNSNCLTQCSGYLSYLSKLEILDISRNKIQELEKFENLRSIRQIYFQYNLISVIKQDYFYGLFKLEVLNLSHNKINDIRKESFVGLLRLKLLCLNHNQIKMLQKSFFSTLGELEILLLHSNSISYIQKYTLNLLSSLKLLTLFNNYLAQVVEKNWISQKNFKRISFYIDEFDSSKIKHAYKHKQFASYRQLLKRELSFNEKIY